MNILVTGGTGFVGSRLCDVLAQRGHQLTVLSRDARRAGEILPEGTRVIAAFDEIDSDEEVDGIVNLAGESIASGRWTSNRKKELFDSRVQVTTALGQLVRRLKKRPRVLVNGSAVGFYGNAGSMELDEDSPAVKRDFTYLLCDAWERAARDVARSGLRLCVLRIGVVLGNGGGMLGPLLPVYRAGLGAQLGNGLQWFSWIHREDLVELVVRCLETPGAEGVYNAVAPEPVTHHRFHKSLAAACHRPGLLRVPAMPLRLALGEMSVLLLGGQKVLPRRLMREGFQFAYPDIESALAAVTARPRPASD